MNFTKSLNVELICLEFRWITSKEIPVTNIPRWHNEIEKIIYIFEKELPTSSMDIQFHLLVHSLKDIQLASLIRCKSMFFLKRYKNSGVCKETIAF